MFHTTRQKASAQWVCFVFGQIPNLVPLTRFRTTIKWLAVGSSTVKYNYDSYLVTATGAVIKTHLDWALPLARRRRRRSDVHSSSWKGESISIITVFCHRWWLDKYARGRVSIKIEREEKKAISIRGPLNGEYKYWKNKFMTN